MVAYLDDMDNAAHSCLWLRNIDMREIHGKTYYFNEDNKKAPD
ncbi:hypothetical protein J2780_002808 [Chryseobacterium camelliae]|nr:hypothetical protein [Chryseobacterium camelliae]